MRSHDFLFVSICAFLAGIISGGFEISPAQSALCAVGVATALFFVFNIRFSLVLTSTAVFLVGNMYYTVDDYRYNKLEHTVKDVGIIEGRVVDEPRRKIDSQTAEIKILSSNVDSAVGARVYVRLDSIPEISYGDIVHIEGEVVPPPEDSYGNYMAKEHVHGSLFYPSTTVRKNSANPVLGALFGIRSFIQENLERVFTTKQAAFLSGIMLGDKDGFSPEFLEKLSASGTMHLMALSGLNMTIIVFSALGIFSVIFWKRRRAQFIATFSVVTLFVAMTGFQVSAIRAALMAFLVGFAGISGRLYNPRNTIACAALILTLFNPKAPVFDLGFQLSFLATIAIIYVTPIVKRLSIFQTDGILGWRDVLAITLAAQIGVFPITIINFANFSFTSLLANIAILAVIPLLTVFGFVIAAATMLFEPLGALLAKPAAFLIDYVVIIVETFAVVRIPFNPEFGFITVLLYYAVVVWICWRYSPSRPHDGTTQKHT